jgi:thioesterase domain-containing protein
MTDLQRFAEQVRVNIPLTRHLDFRMLGWDGERLTMSAALAPNINDKGTLFAGSQTALLTLAGWAYSTLLAEPLRVDVVAATSTMAFNTPIRADMEIVASAPGEACARFCQRLARKGRAPLAVQVLAREIGGDWASEYRGNYLATVHPAGDDAEA